MIVNPFKTISIGLGPNFQIDDIGLSVSLIFQPWKYHNHQPQEKLKSILGEYLNKKHVFLFDKGRTGLYFLLKAMGVGNGDEVIIQAFTCSVVPGSIIQAGAKPLYVDIDETINLDSSRLHQAINSRTKAVIIQHTFGKAANIAEIIRLCDEKEIPLIEDLAHGLGGQIQGRALGTFGKAAFLSFGRDKVISGVWGGAVATNDDILARKVNNLLAGSPSRSILWTLKQLMYPLLVYFVINTYKLLDIGKVLHFLLRRAHLLSDALSSDENQGVLPKTYYSSLPSPLCSLVLKQWHKLPLFIKHRQMLAKYYSDEFGISFDPDCTYLRFSLKVDNPDGLRKFTSSQNVFLGDWYNSPVAPKGIQLENFAYNLYSCPIAEEESKIIINLPTCSSVSINDAHRVVELVKQWKSKQ